MSETFKAPSRESNLRIFMRGLEEKTSSISKQVTPFHFLSYYTTPSPIRPRESRVRKPALTCHAWQPQQPRSSETPMRTRIARTSRLACDYLASGHIPRRRRRKPYQPQPAKNKRSR